MAEDLSPVRCRKRKQEQERENGTHSLAFKQRISLLYPVFPPFVFCLQKETSSVVMHKRLCFCQYFVV